MLINYWDCKYCDYDYIYDENNETHIYACNHSENKDQYCNLDNKYNYTQSECILAEKQELINNMNKDKLKKYEISIRMKKFYDHTLGIQVYAFSEKIIIGQAKHALKDVNDKIVKMSITQIF